MRVRECPDNPVHRLISALRYGWGAFLTRVAVLIMLSCVGMIGSCSTANYSLLDNNIHDGKWFEGKNLLDDGTFGKPGAGFVVPEYLTLTREKMNEIQKNGRWHLIVHDYANAGFSYTENGAHVRINTRGREWYAVQLCYLPLRLEEGKRYLVRFSMKAEPEAVMTFEICSVGLWTTYAGRYNFDVPREWTTKTFEFVMRHGTNPEARFEFNLGSVSGGTDLYFDDVYVCEAAE